MSNFDEQLLRLLNEDRGLPWLDTAMAVASSLDFWLPFLVLAGLLTLLRGGFRARAFLVCLALTIALMDGLVVNTLKKALERPRPSQVLEGIRSIDLQGATPRFLALGRPLRIRESDPGPPPHRGRSLPSAHTANMFAFATLLTLFYPRRGWLLFPVAAFVAVSRVQTGSHWPSDVVLSALLGILLTLLLAGLYRCLWKSWAPRVFPSLHARHPNLLRP